jgi:hypothetical protein
LLYLTFFLVLYLCDLAYQIYEIVITFFLLDLYDY